MSDNSCVLDEARFYDPETDEWGYAVVCLAKAHVNRQCPDEHEMFRYKPKGAVNV